MKTLIDVQKMFESLQRQGFVHVTGLVARDLSSDFSRMIVAPRRDWGKWDSNNGVIAVITEDGHFWLRAWDEKINGGEIQSLLREVCPNGRGCGVSCSNGEAPDFYLLMKRVAYPMWEGDTECLYPADPAQAELRVEPGMTLS